MWVVALCLTLACCTVSGQPVACHGDDQCAEGYYCETSTHTCLECLQCVDLKREPPSNSAQSSCVKSLIHCGPCLEGFVVDHRGDVNAQCISADSRQDSPMLPPLVWVLIAVAILIIVGTAAFCCYKSYGEKKVLVSASISSMYERAGAGAGRGGEGPTAPYNPHYNYVPNDHSPAPPPYFADQTHEDTSRPFIKRAPPSDHQDARESSGNQEANVFCLPSYGDEDDPSSSPEATEDESTEDVHNNNVRRRDKNSTPSWMPHDEETVASTWTPYDDNTTAAINNNNNNNINNNHGEGNDNVYRSRRRAAGGGDDATNEVDSALTSQVACVASTTTATTTVALPPPPHSAAKRTCVRQESSERACDGGAAPGDPPGAPPGAAPPQPSTSRNQILTVIANINIGNNLINNPK